MKLQLLGIFTVITISFQFSKSLRDTSKIYRTKRAVRIQPIGVILDENDADDYMVGLEYAVSRTGNKIDWHRNNGLEVRMQTVNTRSRKQLINAICELMTDGVFLFIGTSVISSSKVTKELSKRFNMPLILASRTANELVDDYVIQMQPSLVQPLVSHLQTIGWKKRVYFVYDHEEAVSILQEIYKRTVDSKHVWINPIYVSSYSRAHDHLRTIDATFIRDGQALIVLDMQSKKTMDIMMRKIRELGMVIEGYYYIINNLNIATTNLSRMVHGGANFTGFRLAISSENEAIKLFKSEKNTERVNLDKAALMIDSVVLAQRALQQLSSTTYPVYRHRQFYNGNILGIPCNEQALPWVHGKAIRDVLLSTRFNGITGPISFSSNGIVENTKVDYVKTGLNTPLQKIGQYEDNTIRYNNAGDGMPEFINQEVNLTAIRVTSIMTSPFLQKKRDADSNELVFDGKGKPVLEGFSIDLMNLIKDILVQKSKVYHRTFYIDIVKDKQYGAATENGTWNGMIGELTKGEADMAIAPLTITSERERVVDFTTPFLETGISIMIKKPERQKPGVFSFLDPFSNDIWYCTLCGYVATTIIHYLGGKISPLEWKKEIRPDGTVKTKTQFTMLNSLWFVVAAFMQQGTDYSTKSHSGRLAGASWWFFTLILISSYTANLAAFLTVERLVTSINNANDLAEQTDIKYGTVMGGSTLTFFQNEINIGVYKRMGQFMETTPGVNTASVEEGVNRVRNSKGKYAFLMEASMNEYWNQRKPCTTMKVGENLDSKGYGVALPLNSPYKDDVEDAVLQLKELGELQKLMTKWWYDKGQCFASTGQDTKLPTALTLRNLTGIFYILIGGLCLAMLVGILEFIWRTHMWWSTNKSNREGGEEDGDKIEAVVKDSKPDVVWMQTIYAKTKRREGSLY